MTTPDETPAPPAPARVEAARLDDLASGTGREFAHDGRAYALFRVGDRAFVLAGLCPHQKAHLADGAVDPAQQTVTCPRRGCLRWRFRLVDGAHDAGLPVACPTFPTRVEGGVVVVDLPA